MKQGQRGCCPFPLHPKSPLEKLPSLCSGLSRLTIPNTYSTITMPASLRSDCCSPSLRNAVRLPSGISVQLHRNTQQTDYSEIIAMEQELMAEGMPVEEVRSMCDPHSRVTREVLVQIPTSKTIAPGHPVDTFRRENEALRGVIVGIVNIATGCSVRPHRSQTARFQVIPRAGLVAGPS